ncbi:PIG-L family deacetylase [bacterium]|nr:PIG-L family deacetylase [bacterium]
MKHTTVLIALCFLLQPAFPAFSQDTPPGLDPSRYREGYDIPAGVDHGTWDFDEWPGVDHGAVYVRDFMYGDAGDKVKIDYTLTVFDDDDHTGYLRTPSVLAERFSPMSDVLRRAKKVIGIFAHPDDEVLLAGGLLAAAAAQGKGGDVFLLSNGADGSAGFDENETEGLDGYNCAGIMPDGSIRVATDLKGIEKPRVARRYGKSLGVDIRILPVRYELDGQTCVQIGEYPGLDFKKSFGPGTVMRRAMARSILDLLRREKPDIIITHGSGGEYGNYFHVTVHDLVADAARRAGNEFILQLFTGFPEYNYSDHITHYLDLDADGGVLRKRKFDAFRHISYIYRAGNDYDKPWNPNDKLMDGVFVKDYGYTPTEGKPPRYEFFQQVRLR